MRKVNAERGQALIEGLAANIILLLICFGGIELARLLSYRSVLQIAANEIALQLSHQELWLEREGHLEKQRTARVADETPLERQASKAAGMFTEVVHSSSHTVASGSIEHQNSQIRKGAGYKVESAGIVFSVYIDRNKAPKGVFVSANAGLPLLLAGIYTTGRGVPQSKGLKDLSLETTWGKDATPGRDWTGRFQGLAGQLYFPLKISAYHPWQASTEIFKRGVPEPKNDPSDSNGNKGLDTHDIEVPIISSILPTQAGSIVQGVLTELMDYISLYEKYEWDKKENSRRRIETAIRAKEKEPDGRFKVTSFFDSVQEGRKEQ
jgi:hypothetical protein